MYKRLAPRFLNQLDKYLLTTHPIIWVSKIHYVVWFGIWFYLLSIIIGFLMPVNLKATTNVALWYTLLSILSFVLFWFWAYRYLVFNKEKKYGIIRQGDAHLNFFLVFVCTAIFCWSAAPFAITYTSKIANSYTDDEVINDINTLNELEPFILTDYQNYQVTYDTSKHETYFNVNLVVRRDYYTPYIVSNDSAKYPSILTNYELAHNHKIILNPDSIKAKVVLHKAICKKYGITTVSNINEDTVTAKYIQAKKIGWLNIDYLYNADNYYKYEMRSIIHNLIEAKFGRLFILETDFLWGMFYFIFSLSSLLVLFKQNYWQQFSITILILVLYPILSYILSSILLSTYGGEQLYIWFIFSAFIFSIVSLCITGKQNKVFKPFFNVFNQLFFLVIIYMPMLIAYFLKRFTSIFNNFDFLPILSEKTENYETANKAYYYFERILAEYWSKQYDYWFTICKVAPVIIFIICLPLIHKLFLKQLALPKSS